MIQFVKYPDPGLLASAEQVKTINSDIIRIADKLRFAMLSAKAYGIAANQLGYNKAMFVYSYEKDHNKIILNPRLLSINITEERDPWPVQTEGCLSLPKQEFQVARPNTIIVEYMDLKGNLHEDWINGMKSRIFQHEMDHLSGILINNKTTEAKQ